MKKINSFSFQGVSGAYSELAGKKLYPDANSYPCATFEEMFEQVRIGNVDAAMAYKFLNFTVFYFCSVCAPMSTC